MPADKVRDQGDKEHTESTEAKILKSADAQASRNAGVAEVSTVEKTRTNASNGSLHRFSGIDLDAQNESIEIDFGDRIVSRNRPGKENTAPELAVQPVLKPVLPEELTAVALPLDPIKLPDELTAVAVSINEPLKRSGSMDVHASHPAHSLEVHGRIIPPPEHKGNLLHGSVEENVERQPQKSKPEHNAEGWLQAAHALAKLPFDQQLQILSKASTAGGDGARQVVIDGTIGAIVGPTEVVGHFLENLAYTTDFVGAVLGNNKTQIAEHGDRVCTSLAQAVINSSDFLFETGNYLGALGSASYYGDNGKIFRDADRMVQRLDREWLELPVQEKTRILMGVYAELYIEKLLSSSEFEEMNERLLPKMERKSSLMLKLEALHEKYEPLEKASGALKLVGSVVKEVHEASEHSKPHQGGTEGAHSVKRGEVSSVRSEFAIRGLLAPLIRRVNTLDD